MTTAVTQEGTLRCGEPSGAVPSTLIEVVRRVPVAENVTSNAVRLVRATRAGTKEQAAAAGEFLAWGAGPRAAQFLVRGAKTRALLDGRPGDVIRVCTPAGEQELEIVEVCYREIK